MGQPGFNILQTVKEGRERKCGGLRGGVELGVICITVEIDSMFSENIAKSEKLIKI